MVFASVIVLPRIRAILKSKGRSKVGRTVLLTGRPGVGKTTLIRAVLAELPGTGGGFFTQEVRSQGMRLGFDIVTLAGDRLPLARRDVLGLPRVGRYGVYVENMVRLAVPAIHSALLASDYVIIDEIGKMELLAPTFREAVLEAVSSPSPVLGTVMQGTDPWVDALKRQRVVRVLTVTEDNRSELQEVVLRILCA